MASTSTFRSFVGKRLPSSNVSNATGAPAYALSAQHALAQYAATGCFNATYYASAEAQLERVIALAYSVSPSFLAQTAIFSRERGAMKDMPALLCAALSVAEPRLCAQIFPRVIDDAKMLRNFVQILRSGVTGRKSWVPLRSAWSRPGSRRAATNSCFVHRWARARHWRTWSRWSTPSRRRMRAARFTATCSTASTKSSNCRRSSSRIEAFKLGHSSLVPDVPFQMLTALPLNAEQWVTIAKNANWQTTRMNLNTFARHGVFTQRSMTTLLAARLRDKSAILQARAFPYQLLAAYRASGADVPSAIREALQDAMEISISNVPAIDGKVYVLVDVSGSMSSPITGHRRGSTSSMRCIDGAALVAAAILRKNPQAEVIPFEAKVVSGLRLNPRDSVMTNAEKLAAIGGGGTNCSAPLSYLNAQKATGDLVVFVSDNESWVDARRGPTAVMLEWQAFKARNPEARLACIDFVPNATTQAAEGQDILNVGGFSDAVFDLLASFAKGKMQAGHWVSEIEKVEI